MGNVVIIGSQWGDEGKGKIVDWLSLRADVVVRFQGGHNAGHTLNIDGKVYKLNLLPSGIVRKNKLSIIGGAVVVDPWALVMEIEKIQKQGIDISPKNLMISENATLILPALHSKIDHVREHLKGNQKIGTTGRGIGPAYEDKVARRAIRVCDLGNHAELTDRVEGLVEHYNILFKAAGEPIVDKAELILQLKEIRQKITPYIGVVWQKLAEVSRAGKNILFEGAQGALLDVDHGTYPFVTSSNTHAGQAACGSGVGANLLHTTVGITKAYTTRVGSGPFPTELFCEIKDHLATIGKEIGTVTGRDRRCGWFDAVLTRQVAKINGLSAIALTKLDVLDKLDELKICIAYDIEGARYNHLPASSHLQKLAKPIYITMEGWKHSTYGCRDMQSLPKQALAYILKLQELIETEITIISTSPEREDTILLSDPFSKKT